jgi:hypothetical protein
MIRINKVLSVQERRLECLECHRIWSGRKALEHHRERSKTHRHAAQRGNCSGEVVTRSWPSEGPGSIDSARQARRRNS